MCLRVDKEFSDKWLAKQKAAGRTKVVCWKILRRIARTNPRVKLTSVVFDHSRWVPGWKRSGRRGKPRRPTHVVDRAIHVYLDKPPAPRCPLRTSRRIVPVTCYVKDFIAAAEYGDASKNGDWRSSRDINEAAFTKVFLAKEDYKKALRGT